MKNKYFLGLALLVSFLFSKSSLAQWNWQALPNAPKSYRFDDMYFLTPQIGWVTNPYHHYFNPSQFGRIFRTLNGGTTWQLMKDSSLTYFRSIGFADSLNGWVGNLADTAHYGNYQATPDAIPLYRTSNGGFTWSPVNNIPNPKPAGICGISIVTDSVIYAYGRYWGPPIIIKTVDKGTTWTSTDLSQYASGLIDGHFFSKDTGFVSGSSPSRHATILSTFNGGATWQVRYLSTRADTDGVWKFSFPSRNIGYASIEHWGYSSSPFYSYILRTQDGGLTWTEILGISNYQQQGIGFLNNNLGWLGGDQVGMNFKSGNGGSNWTWDFSFGVNTPPYNPFGGFSINRFRRFGDTLMYGCGNTVYKLQIHTGINELSEAATNIFPNPFTSSATFEFDKELKNAQLKLFDVLGKEIRTINFSGKQIILQREKLESGVYFYQIYSDETNTCSGKLIVD